MKKFVSVICTVLMMSAALSACNNGADNASGTSASTTSAPDVTTTSTASAAEAPELVIADNSVDFAENLKLGWNLGNSLDATGEGLDSEVSWGQPTISKAQIMYVKNSGFTSIRIPVSWSNHVDEDLNIDPAWTARVKEVIDYAYESGLYIIMNSHHDNEMYYPNSEHYEESEKYIRKIWTQIADNFSGYDERLIFESMNEPRLAGTAKEWWFTSNDPDGIDSIECIVKLNQVFVDTVRGSGKGYNSSRYLMVPSNAANADNALSDHFTMPDDPSGRLLLSVHAYSPYDFAMNKNGYKVWDGSKINELGFMKKLNKKFVQNGYGVVIGEFGATNKNNLDDRVAWAKDFTSLAASNGISCFWWDNGGIMVGEENFGLISRRDYRVFYPALLDALLSGYQPASEDAAA